MMYKDTNEAVMDDMDRLHWVRETTLSYCYSIPDYQYLNRDTQGDIYETIRELVERLDSAYALIERIESGKGSK